MQDAILKSSRDTLLVAVPFVVCLVGGMFRLDGLSFESGIDRGTHAAYPGMR
jgi:hypothetical protein